MAKVGKRRTLGHEDATGTPRKISPFEAACAAPNTSRAKEILTNMATQMCQRLLCGT